MQVPQLQLQMLVVDDDDLDRERVRRFLTRSPLQVDVTEAASGAEALRLVRSQVFDCVVLDNQLGDASGRELLPQLRREAFRDCPIIFITGTGNEALAVHVMQEGAADYLAKSSLNAEALVRAVRRSIENHRLQCENELLRQQLERRVEEQDAAIRQGERDLRALVDNAPTLMSYWNADERCRFANLPHAEWFGVDTSALPETRLQDLLGPDLWKTFEPAVQRALQGRAASFECIVPERKALAARHAQVRLQPDLSEDGGVTGFYLSIVDIEPQKLAQARIQELLAFSDAVIENSPIGIAVFGVDGACVLANAAFTDLCGDTLDELREQDFRLRRDWQASGLVEAALSTLRDGQARRGEFTLRTGTRIGGEWACALTRVDRGGIAQLLLIARDIGEQRRVHAALIEARDGAQAAARAKSAFLANMSHEIRTPMNAIVGLSRLALEDELPAPARAYLDKVYNAAVALMGVLDDVLDYSKIEAGHLRIERVAVDLEELLLRVVDLFQARIEQQDLSLSVALSPDLPRLVWGDPLRLSQVLNNLVGNAAKFTERGGIRLAVEVDASEGAAGKSVMRFSVADSGIGISPEACSALFEAFVQADGAVTRRFGGTGLGLAICKRLVGMMGGQIGVESEPGSGSEFWFTLPLEPAPSLADVTPRRGLAGVQVLVVDGGDPAGAATVRDLQTWGAQAVSVAGLVQAAAWLEKQGDAAASRGVVLVDAGRMQAADVEHLEQLARRQPRPRIIAVASTSERARLRLVAGGAVVDAVLPRPVMASRLLEVLSAAAENAGWHAGGLVQPPAMHRSAAAAAEALRELAAPLRGRRVLLVEDNPLNQVVAAEMLRRAGMVVTIAADGSTALDEVRATPTGYAAVLMDLHMPGIDGLEAARRICGMLPEDQRPPIIGMTAAALPEDRARCLGAGMVDHVPKPVLPDRLVRTLLRWVRPAGASANGVDEVTASPAPARAGASESGDTAVFDPNVLREQVHGNERLVREVVSIFIQRERDTADMLAACMASGDLARARGKAHDLLGSAGAAGAKATHDAAGALQRALDEGEGVPERVAALRHALREALAAMAAFLARAAPGSGA